MKRYVIIGASGRGYRRVSTVGRDRMTIKHFWKNKTRVPTYRDTRNFLFNPGVKG